MELMKIVVGCLKVGYKRQLLHCSLPEIYEEDLEMASAMSC